MKFDKQFPELGVPPPATDGSLPVPTKLSVLRQRQLLDLAKAFEVEMPPPRNRRNYTKDELLLYLKPHEDMGTFRQEPKSRYHLLHAQLTHDVRGEEETARLETLQRDLVKAEHQEFPLDNRARYAKAAQDTDSHAFWQQEAKRLGIKGTMGKTREELKAMVEAHKDEVARSAETAEGHDGSPA